MIRATNGIIFTMKPHTNYMYKSVYISQVIRVSDMLVPLGYAFRNNYSSNVNMYSNIIGIKYIREGR